MTTDRSRRRVRIAAITGTALAGVGVAVAVGANPFPASQQPADAAVAALEKRERALSAEATRVNAMNAERWAGYRAALAERQQSYASPQATYVPPAAPVASSGSS